MSGLKNIFFLAFCFLQFTVTAQVTVTASVTKNKILIGEQFNLTLETRLPASQPTPVISIDTIPHFEILNTGMPMEAVSGSEKIIKQEYRLTSFDSGHWVIPSFRIAGKFLTDTIPMDVVFSDFDPNQPYHDITDIIEVEPAFKQKWWWYILGGAVLLIALLIWILTRKKKAGVPVEKEVDPYEEALASLEAIKNKTGSPKDFYSELVDIFRLYTWKRKGILSLQKTTDDLIIQLNSIPLQPEKYTELSQALRLSDFVKFAKYPPTSEDNRFIYNTIKEAVITIEQIK
jgi:LPXTG-motif cell wall-anchored protein